MIAARIIAALIGYAFGNISLGVIVGKMNRVDIHKEGSGNVGATNVARSIGLKAGLITAIADCFKAVVPAIIIWAIYKDMEGYDAGLLMVYAAISAQIGHMFPVVMRFKGGKGVATILGVMMVAAPLSILINVTLFFAIAIATRYVSLGSIIAVSTLPVTIGIFIATGLLPYTGQAAVEVMILFIIGCFFSVFLHRDNIKRLKNGTERKFSVKKNNKAA